MKEVSVVATTYMHGKYICSAIESVIAQTFKDFEFIIIDDGSPDNTAEEVAKIKDKRIMYVLQRPSGLPANSRNRGIEMATGRLIAFFDGDDAWRPNKLERCLDVFAQDPTVDILCHDLDLIDKKGKIVKRTFFGPYPDDLYREFLLKGNRLAITSTVIKRRVFSEDRFLFSEEKRLFTVEDYDLWLRLAKSRQYKFFYLPEILGEHRVSEESASLANIEKNALNIVALLNDNFKNLGIGERKLRRIIKKRKSRIMFGAALAFNYRRNFRESAKWHLKAIRENPLYIKAYPSFFATLLGIRLGYI